LRFDSTARRKPADALSPRAGLARDGEQIGASTPEQPKSGLCRIAQRVCERGWPKALQKLGNRRALTTWQYNSSPKNIKAEISLRAH
jgi:hypothetical protein